MPYKACGSCKLSRTAPYPVPQKLSQKVRKYDKYTPTTQSCLREAVLQVLRCKLR